MEFVQPIRDVKQIAAMKAYLHSNARDYCLFVVGINSGLRISDLLSLTVGDVRGADRVRIRERKTGKSKNFALGKGAQDAIQAYLAIRPRAKAADWLFASPRGGAITRQQAWRVLNAAAASAGITEPIGTHTLRKTFAYHAYQAGTDLSLLQHMLNHAAPSVTLRYIGITQDQADQVYLGLDL